MAAAEQDQVGQAGLAPIGPVGSAWGAVSAFPPVRFPRPPARTGRAAFTASALHESVDQATSGSPGHGVGITAPRYRYLTILIDAGLNRVTPSCSGSHPLRV